jgi:uncharacterized protein with HEPN domain
MRGDADYLHDIIEAADRVASYIVGQSEASFSEDLMRRDAVLYRLAVVGEAAGRLSKAARDARPDVPWNRIVAMRNILVHDYGGVDIVIAWDTATVHVPALVTVVRQMLPPDDPLHLTIIPATPPTPPPRQTP